MYSSNSKFPPREPIQRSFHVTGNSDLYIFTPTVLLFRRLIIVVFYIKVYAVDSNIVYSNVYPNKKTNQSDVTPSGWLSTVGPAGLEPATP